MLGKCPSFLFILDRPCWVSQKAWNRVAQAGLELEILTLAGRLYPASRLPAPHLLCSYLLFIMPYFLAPWVPPATALGSTVQSATYFYKEPRLLLANGIRTKNLGAGSRCWVPDLGVGAPSAPCSHSSVTIVHVNALTPLPQYHWRVTDTWSQSARSKCFCLFLESPPSTIWSPRLSDFYLFSLKVVIFWNMLCGMEMKEQNLCICLIPIELHGCVTYLETRMHCKLKQCIGRKGQWPALRNVSKSGSPGGPSALGKTSVALKSRRVGILSFAGQAPLLRLTQPCRWNR